MAEFLAMGVWFSASAVAPQLAAEWRMGPSGGAWLTMSVQLGFVAGTLLSALLNLADRLPLRWFFSASALLASASTLAIALVSQGPETALPLRFATGFFLAGVYPVGMRIMATWTKANRGFGIGLVVGALTLGTAAPHLLRQLLGARDWRGILTQASMLALAGACVAVLLRDGPYAAARPRFEWSYALSLFRRRGARLPVGRPAGGSLRPPAGRGRRNDRERRLRAHQGWPAAFAALAIGPALGAWAMLRLRSYSSR